MIDVESGGNPGGDQSDGINRANMNAVAEGRGGLGEAAAVALAVGVRGMGPIRPR